MVWENGIETCILYVKLITSPGSMHDTGCLGLVHWDNPEGWDGEEGGRGVQDGEHMYLHHTHGDLTSLAPHERLSELPVVPREKSEC